MLTNACKALAKHWLSRHHPTFGAAYILELDGHIINLPFYNSRIMSAVSLLWQMTIYVFSSRIMNYMVL